MVSDCTIVAPRRGYADARSPNDDRHGRTAMSANLEAALSRPPALVVPGLPTGRGYRFLVGSAIVLGLVGISVAWLHGGLFRLITRAIDGGGWSGSLLGPALIWISIGLSMLVIRTALWFLYRPFDAASYESAPMMTAVIS